MARRRKKKPGRPKVYRKRKNISIRIEKDEYKVYKTVAVEAGISLQEFALNAMRKMLVMAHNRAKKKLQASRAN